ncbi:hypothetical protein AOCH_001482 [Aspergillus ochraceoroseus]|uniref:RRM domain-containing protein n=1 Tax=Aspergillus ochraceoroseus TaxID=138278 RepID=A0A0F8UU04_9EURO|nr:hypothetical protein AOCH_001482 [Aspergillus ochraceoroseus]
MARSVSPRPESRARRSSRSPLRENSLDNRNGHRLESRSRSRSRSRRLSVSRSRSRSRSVASRSYRDRSYTRSLSPPGASRSSKIVIEKLTKNVTEAHLHEIFGGFGEIQSLDLPMNNAFMTNRGTAYIVYHDPADAEAAIAHMHEAQLDGAVLSVSIAMVVRGTPEAHLWTAALLAIPHTHLGPLPREGIAGLAPWKGMIFTGRGLFPSLDLDRLVALDRFLLDPRLHLQGEGHEHMTEVLVKADGVALATVATGIAAVAGAEPQVEKKAAIDCSGVLED